MMKSLYDSKCALKHLKITKSTNSCFKLKNKHIDVLNGDGNGRLRIS